jgi:hypothetical protein
MTSIRQQVHEIVSTDSLVLALVGAGADGLLGHPVSSPDTDVAPLPTAPWGALKWNALVPAGIATSFVSTSDTVRAGEWEWWIYDTKQAGYGRLDALADALIASYATYFNSPDALTGERARLFDSGSLASVWGVKVGLASGELADPNTDQRLIRVRWSYRTRYATSWN